MTGTTYVSTYLHFQSSNSLVSVKNVTNVKIVDKYQREKKIKMLNSTPKKFIKIAKCYCGGTENHKNR